MRLFRRSVPPVSSSPKAYLYVSDAKVDMYIDGLDRSLQERFALKVRAGVPGLNAEISSRQADLGRFARATRLCAALDAEGRVGSILDEGTEFFRGELLAVWGFWNRWDEGYADVVFFTGFADGGTLVGIGGSAYHTMERAGDRLQQYSNSGIQMLMASLKERSEASQSKGHGYRHDFPGAWYSELWDADHDNSLVPEPIEFVAERLLDRSMAPDRRSIIGSRIYAARTGEPIGRRTFKEHEALRSRHALDHDRKPRFTRRSGHWEIGKPSFPSPAPLHDPEEAEHASGASTTEQ